ncbi:hypothetical protein R3W88_009288 [Solanum pinnatisectum]|uniref:Uncharacterized protein n=1 Tax=Solanum pinnatisectum TaxID=50273 RepID=A0AAV9ME50_9SOLN|nr:hypothetical protein R3W88_009288 [Solanum pinnatisectum]
MPVPVLDTTGKEAKLTLPRSSYRMDYTNRGPYGGDIYLDYSPAGSICPDGVFRYGQVRPKGTPVRLITPSHFGPGVYEDQDINIQFVISNVEKSGKYTIWKVGPYDREERVSFLETGQQDSKSCFKIIGLRINYLRWCISGYYGWPLWVTCHLISTLRKSRTS